MLKLLVITLLFPWMQVLAHKCRSSYTQSNMKLQGHSIKSLSTIETSDECSDKCAPQTDCHSINYDSSQRICELNDANHLSHPESLVYSVGFQYFLRAGSGCSNKLCSYPLECEVDKNRQDYKCVSCKDKNKVLLFPKQTNTDSVIYEPPSPPSFTAFTISIWAQFSSRVVFHTPFSYATNNSDNEILIEVEREAIALRIDGSAIEFPHAFDSNWHHICLTWNNVNGSYTMYIDGTSKIQGSMKTGHVIQKGAVVLGQDQDSYKGGFQKAHSFQGNMTNVNMWDRVLTTDEVSALASRCSSAEGNVFKWRDLYDKTTGDIMLICSHFCDI